MSEVGDAAPQDRTRQAARRVSYLDRTLWSELNQAATQGAFCKFWLALQCRMVPGVRKGVVHLGRPEAGPYNRVASWPGDEAVAGELETAVTRALKERQGVVHGHARQGAPAGSTCFAAYPFVFQGALYGAVALEVLDRPEDELRILMQQLQWGAAWVEFWHFRRAAAADRALIARATTTLDLIAGAIEEERFDATCLAAMTETATRLGCERVSIGLRERGHARVMALSHTARLGKRMNLVRALGTAMDEAIDQETAILYPNGDGQGALVTSAHAALTRGHGAGAVFTVPFAAENRYLGAITFERRDGESFDQSDVDLMECLASGLGPIIALRRRDDRLLIFKIAASARRQLVRLFGPRYYGRKLAAMLALALGAFLALATDDYRLTAPAELEGLVHRVVASPFDGYVLEEWARAGDVVRRGQVLAKLDDHDLAVERLRWISAQAQKRAEHDQALAEHQAAGVNVFAAQIDQAKAEIELLDEQIERAHVRAPFDGLIISGDLSQSVGAAVERGTALFEVAPLAAYRVILEVDERDITDLRVGQYGKVLMSSIPDEPLPFTVALITPVSEAREGRNFFRVEGRLSEVSGRLRPGMKGIAKVDIEERRLIWIWTHRMIDWFRIQLWAWWP